MEDYYAKLDKAIEASKRGMAYLHVFSPCPTGWRFPPEPLIEVARKAVQTNMVPLWEFAAAEGEIRFTHPVDNPLPVEAFLSLIGKYRHLSEEQVTHIEQTIERRLQIIKSFQKPAAAAAGRG